MVNVGIAARGGELGVEAVMEHPLWMLVPWTVFALAAGLKFWRLTTAFRRHLLGTASRTERFRKRLEQLWLQDRQNAG
jgi:hypothetical protein